VCKPPRGDIQSFRGQIFSLTDARRNLETRALILGQLLVRSVKSGHQGEFSNICNSYREFPELHFVDLSVHA
jgi:hypothetical protein